MLQWLELPAWKVRDRGFGHRSGMQISKKQKCLFPALNLIQFQFKMHLLAGQTKFKHQNTS